MGAAVGVSWTTNPSFQADGLKALIEMCSAGPLIPSCAGKLARSLTSTSDPCIGLSPLFTVSSTGSSHIGVPTLQSEVSQVSQELSQGMSPSSSSCFLERANLNSQEPTPQIPIFPTKGPLSNVTWNPKYYIVDTVATENKNLEFLLEVYSVYFRLFDYVFSVFDGYTSSVASEKNKQYWCICQTKEIIECLKLILELKSKNEFHVQIEAKISALKLSLRLTDDFLLINNLNVDNREASRFKEDFQILLKEFEKMHCNLTASYIKAASVDGLNPIGIIPIVIEKHFSAWQNVRHGTETERTREG